MALGAYLGRWLEYQRARGVRPRTLDAYEGYIRREILPSIGGLELGKIRPGHVRAVLTRMQQRGLASATIAQVRSVLGSALRQAMEDGLIPANPVTAVKRPRVRRAEPHWPTSAQLGALCRPLRNRLGGPDPPGRGHRGTPIGGPGHLLGRRRPKTGTIFIRRGVQPVREAGRTHTAAFTPLKTKRARRVVQLPPFALERVREHRREQMGRRIALGPGWHDPLNEEGRPVALVCERADGSFLYPDSFSSAFKRLARRAGLHPSIRLHDVRHAVATELGRQRVHPVIVSAVLGHASPAFTIAVYQHAWQEGPPRRPRP
jgi:integrase